LARTLARPVVSQTYALRSFAAAAADKGVTFGELEFIVPSDWDLDYLKKFEVPVPTAEQMAKAVPSPLELAGRVGELASDLFECASVYDVLDTVASELQAIRAEANKNPQFAEFVEEKANTKKDVRVAFEQVFKDASPVLKKFVARMVENNEFYRLLGLADNFTELIRAHKKEMNVTLHVAKLPSPDKLEILKARASFYHLPRGANPIWDIKEKPELLSGYSLSTKDFTVDTSGAKKKKDLQDRLAAVFAKVDAALPATEATTPMVVTTAEEVQKLATALNERRAEIKESEDAHYRAHFLDWV